MSARILLSFLIAALVAFSEFALPMDFKYDESKVPDFTLLAPLTLDNGDRVADADTWKNKRRAEFVELFETHVYGRTPEDASGVRFGDALVAPRPLYVASAKRPCGLTRRENSCRSHLHRLCTNCSGGKAFGDVKMPAADEPSQRDVAYHIRTARHDITNCD